MDPSHHEGNGEGHVVGFPGRTGYDAPVSDHGDGRHDDPPAHGHAHHGRRGNRTLSDYARDFFRNWSDYEGSLTEMARLTLRNRAKAYLLPPIRGCCGHPGQPGC